MTADKLSSVTRFARECFDVVPRAASVASPAPPLVLLRELVWNAASWDEAVLQLPRDSAARSLDLAGRGGSDRSVDPVAYALDAQAEVLPTFLPSFECRPALVSYSIGGRVALAVVAQDLRALVLEGACLGPASPDERNAANAARLHAEDVPSFMKAWGRLPLFVIQRDLLVINRERVRTGCLVNYAEVLARSSGMPASTPCPLARMSARPRIAARLRHSPVARFILRGSATQNIACLPRGSRSMAWLRRASWRARATTSTSRRPSDSLARCREVGGLAPSIAIVLLNNGGGIFDMLPQKSEELVFRMAVSRLHGVDYEARAGVRRAAPRSGHRGVLRWGVLRAAGGYRYLVHRGTRAAFRA